ncbi:hypothetical protein LR48_Vigan02g069900 [Vigna angularis]|uniref:Uncharacterized protein n=1 Tax=Phaseolus angularis TaxID=3914 RepID=A0A0L9TWK2_PHAAN|nr:hypothetical protein LR48_Vigan02g069900 [Vigna angularis]
MVLASFAHSSPPKLHSSPRVTVRGSWRLFQVEEDGSRIGDGDANGKRNWSVEQLQRTLGKAMHTFVVSILPYLFNFVEP